MTIVRFFVVCGRRCCTSVAVARSQCGPVNFLMISDRMQNVFVKGTKNKKASGIMQMPSSSSPNFKTFT
jgi:hypothetical protein